MFHGIEASFATSFVAMFLGSQEMTHKSSDHGLKIRELYDIAAVAMNTRPLKKILGAALGFSIIWSI